MRFSSPKFPNCPVVSLTDSLKHSPSPTHKKQFNYGLTLPKNLETRFQHQKGGDSCLRKGAPP